MRKDKIKMYFDFQYDVETEFVPIFNLWKRWWHLREPFPHWSSCPSTLWEYHPNRTCMAMYGHKYWFYSGLKTGIIFCKKISLGSEPTWRQPWLRQRMSVNSSILQHEWFSEQQLGSHHLWEKHGWHPEIVQSHLIQTFKAITKDWLSLKNGTSLKLP